MDPASGPVPMSLAMRAGQPLLLTYQGLVLGRVLLISEMPRQLRATPGGAVSRALTEAGLVHGPRGTGP